MRTVFTSLVALFLAGVIFAVVFGWPVMLLWGAIAGTYDFPTMGFGTAIQVSLLTTLLFKSSSSSSSK